MLFPTFAHIPPHPQAVFVIGVLNAETDNFVNVGTIELFCVFIQRNIYLYRWITFQIRVKRFFLQIAQQNVQTLRSVRLFTPLPQLLDVLFIERIRRLSDRDEVLELIGEWIGIGE